MLKAVAVLAAVALGGVFAFGKIERGLVYPFDTTRVAPQDLGLALREEVFESGGKRLILWVGEARADKPAVLYFHGNAGNLAARAGRFRHFLDRGYGVVALAYRGSSGSEGSPDETKLAYDAGRLLERIGDYAGDAPVVIWGESLGTGVALAAVERAGVQPAAMVLEAPYTSVKAVALAADPRLKPLVEKMANDWNSLARIGALRAPLLVIHGTEDEVIPYEMGRQVFAAAPLQIKEFVTVTGGHHSDLWRSDTLPRLWRFIDRHGTH